MTAANRAALTAFLRAAVASGAAPAIAASVATADDVLFVEGAGLADVARQRAARPDAIFRIASMTKPVTSLATMLLVEQGVVHLDDPVTRYLPTFTHPVVTRFFAKEATFESRAPARPVTIRHLLTHTSGLAYAFCSPIIAALESAGIAEDDRPLLFEPGESWTYGPSTAVLGRLIETCTGRSLGDCLQTWIFDPLELTDTGFSVPAAQHERVVTIQVRQGGTFTERPNPPTIRSIGRGDDGLFSTARDYATFLRLFLNEGRHRTRQIARAETIEHMLADQIAPLVVTDQRGRFRTSTEPFPLGAGKDGFGFGFQIEAAPMADRDWRSVGSGSWSGVFNTHFWVDPAASVAGVVLTQVLPGYDAACLNVLRGVERIVYRALGDKRRPEAGTVAGRSRRA